MKVTIRNSNEGKVDLSEMFCGTIRGGMRGFGDSQALEPYSNEIFSCVTTFGGNKLVVVEIWRGKDERQFYQGVTMIHK